MLRVTSSIGWSCGGCSLGWGYCADRLDLDDLQAPTVAAKALGRTLHAENFSELIWKFDPVRIVRILLFDSVTWGWFPLWAALWAALRAASCLSVYFNLAFAFFCWDGMEGDHIE